MYLLSTLPSESLIPLGDMYGRYTYGKWMIELTRDSYRIYKGIDEPVVTCIIEISPNHIWILNLITHGLCFYKHKL